MHPVLFEDLGLIEYRKAWDYQLAKFQRKIKSKSTEGMHENDYLLFCEHPHVYTIGKSGLVSNLLINESFLAKIEATIFKTDRGGDITYHGPGQIVGYPIIDLANFNLGVKEYVYKIEEAIIFTLGEYWIKAGRLINATGVWLDVEKPGRTRKIAAIGIKASRFITMHGFALNVNTNLDYFGYINPCGFTDKGVTSMQKEIDVTLDIDGVKDKLKINFAKVFGMNLC